MTPQGDGQKPLHYAPTVVTGSQFVLGGGGWLMILLLLQGTQQILLCLSVATWIIEKVVSSITVLFVYTYIFGNKITILFKDVENSIPSYKTSIPFIIPYLHLAFFSFPGTLFATVPPQFLAVALLAVSPICFHSLGQDPLLCSSDTFAHQAAQYN